MKSFRLPNNSLREMVNHLVSDHKEIGYEKLKLAVWFGEKDNISDIYHTHQLNGRTPAP